MATNNAVNISSSGIVKYDGAGTFSGVTVTNHATLVGAASNGITSVLQGAGQILIGTTAGDPSAASLTPGTGISISSVSGAITISSAGAGTTWTTVTGTTQAMAVNNGYVANNAGLVTLTLPATAAVGDVILVAGLGAGGWSIAQNAGQLIHIGNQVTTTGATGTLSSTNAFDDVTLRCIVTNTTFTVMAVQGNLTFV